MTFKQFSIVITFKQFLRPMPRQFTSIKENITDIIGSIRCLLPKNSVSHPIITQYNSGGKCKSTVGMNHTDDSRERGGALPVASIGGCPAGGGISSGEGELVRNSSNGTNGSKNTVRSLGTIGTRSPAIEVTESGIIFVTIGRKVSTLGEMCPGKPSGLGGLRRSGVPRAVPVRICPSFDPSSVSPSSNFVNTSPRCDPNNPLIVLSTCHGPHNVSERSLSSDDATVSESLEFLIASPSCDPINTSPSVDFENLSPNSVLTRKPAGSSYCPGSGSGIIENDVSPPVFASHFISKGME
ncbi:predicted protein [Sclerotinia sclerotiorum 1980 UF-70]|uniref:Uncharacterized protein n=1 Tax=Sclerotinia sclerotiorum (strain ATCC 18683 / 1980 / Ss-1) TaxID=665079 RepID=A7F174_SCLS1|nr:predicted protein [Sclerotinia sclerotiorum 1980 UF-70]EDN95466.1 predicted protein [Sclerotinia sclerotiorum 1980 UF-70]